MNKAKKNLFVMTCMLFLICVSSVKQLTSYGVSDQLKKDEVKVSHSILDEIHLNTYILHINNFYEAQFIYIEEVMLFQFIKPKGLNNQQLIIDYAVVYEDKMHHGTLFIEVRSIFSFAYTNHGKVILVIISVGLLLSIEVMKRKIKKR